MRRLLDVLRVGHTAQNTEQQAAVPAEDLEDAVAEAEETEIVEEEMEAEEESENE